MRQSPLLVFKSSAFPPSPGEDERTNPGIFGRALAQWIAERLRARGLAPGEVFAEDFGWCVPVAGESSTVYVACAGSGEPDDEWRVFAFVEQKLLARLMGRAAGAAPLDRVYAALKDALSTAAEIRELTEEHDA
jgi:hypothetical protein